MSCIKEGLIQKYIDRETTAKEDSVVQTHLLFCNECAEKIENKQRAVKSIKYLISTLNTANIEVPIFCEHDHKKRPSGFYTKRIFNSPIKKLIYTVSAACLIFIAFILFQKPKKKVEIMYLYSIKDEYNANLPISEQEMVIEIIDSEGKLIKEKM